METVIGATFLQAELPSVCQAEKEDQVCVNFIRRSKTLLKQSAPAPGVKPREAKAAKSRRSYAIFFKLKALSDLATADKSQIFKSKRLKDKYKEVVQNAIIDLWSENGVNRNKIWNKRLIG